MNKTLVSAISAAALFLILSTGASAHFGMIIPSADIVGMEGPKEITLKIMFMHPFEGQYLNMRRPKAVGVLSPAGRQDLAGGLNEKKVKGVSAWEAGYRVKRPGDYIFYVEPEPYWEPAEDKFIVHYTKVVVDALGLEGGWDREAGLRAEVVPLTRPYGLWTGNVFQGAVKVDGRPMPGADVEITYYNQGGRVKAPADPYVTQIVKADGSGVFTYAIPRAGWWGFAALTAAPEKMKGPDGKDHPVELGAVIWVRARDMKQEKIR